MSISLLGGDIRGQCLSFVVSGATISLTTKVEGNLEEGDKYEV